MRKNIRLFAGNQCKIADIAFSLDNVTSQKIYAVISVSVQKKFENGKATDEVDGVNYILSDTQTYAQIRVKTQSKTPVITQDLIDAHETPFLVEVPLDETLVKPYKIEYGKVSLSIVAPYVKLVEIEE